MAGLDAARKGEFAGPPFKKSSTSLQLLKTWKRTSCPSQTIVAQVRGCMTNLRWRPLEDEQSGPAKNRTWHNRRWTGEVVMSV
jgi:hypothetical protein